MSSNWDPIEELLGELEQGRNQEELNITKKVSLTDLNSLLDDLEYGSSSASADIPNKITQTSGTNPERKATPQLITKVAHTSIQFVEKPKTAQQAFYAPPKPLEIPVSQNIQNSPSSLSPSVSPRVQPISNTPFDTKTFDALTDMISTLQSDTSMTASKSPILSQTSHRKDDIQKTAQVQNKAPSDHVTISPTAAYICILCKEKIANNAVMIAGHTWHSFPCLRCQRCMKSLEGLKVIPGEAPNKIYCQPCGLKYLHQSGKIAMKK